MLGRKNGNTRIEPSFDAPTKRRGESKIRLSADDRALPGEAVTFKAKAKAKPKPKSRQKLPRKAVSARRKAKSRSRFSHIIRKSAYWGFVLALWAGIGTAGLVAYYGFQLESSTSWVVPERPPNAKIVSTNGELLANRGETGGASTRINEMSPYIPMAVIAIEDHRFRQHFGFDPIGFSRAMVANVLAGRLLQGGSTLTQQLAKNMFLEPERTLERKVQELILSFWLETKYTKDEILEMYLNRVYFGSGAYGVDAASRRYFSKSARDVTLAEAALLAGLLKAPSKLSPARNPKLAEARAQLVLAAMRRKEFISDSEATRALTQEAAKAKQYWSGSEHYVADLVMYELNGLIGDLAEDVIVDTTVNLAMQRKAEETIEETLAQYGKEKNVSQGALVAMSPGGAIRALVGGREYADSQFNRATDARRQPGSAFKPFVYLAALEAGRTPQSVRQDLLVKIGKWTPVNYDRKYRGPVRLSTALAKSLNTVAAQMAMEVGPQKIVSTAKRLGIRSKLQPNASIALGTSEVSLMDLTAAYAPFANGGEAVEPYLIRRVKKIDGTVLYERQLIPPTLVVRPRELGMMNAMLREVIAKGTGRRAALDGRDAAGKTGTTQNSRDGLFVGYTANLVAGIWYGNDDGTATNKVTGGSLPAQSWKTFMESAHQGIPVAALPGNYVPEPEIAVLPSEQMDKSARNAHRSIGDIITSERTDEKRRKSLSEIDGSTRPSNGIGETRQHKSILELLFGSN